MRKKISLFKKKIPCAAEEATGLLAEIDSKIYFFAIICARAFFFSFFFFKGKWRWLFPTCDVCSGWVIQGLDWYYSIL